MSTSSRANARMLAGLAAQAPAERIRTEIGHLYNSIMNNATTRRHHPTYGVRKADLLADYHRLTGYVEAHMIVTGAFTEAGSPHSRLHPYALAEFGINLSGLTATINNACKR